jgi:K+-transporting ATPase KdpF subunit
VPGPIGAPGSGYLGFDLALWEFGRSTVTVLDWIGLTLGVLLLGYLIFALLFPEKF